VVVAIHVMHNKSQAPRTLHSSTPKSEDKRGKIELSGPNLRLGKRGRTSSACHLKEWLGRRGSPSKKDSTQAKQIAVLKFLRAGQRRKSVRGDIGIHYFTQAKQKGEGNRFTKEVKVLRRNQDPPVKRGEGRQNDSGITSG